MNLVVTPDSSVLLVINPPDSCFIVTNMVTNHYFEDRCPTLMVPTMGLQIFYVIDHSPIQYFDKRVSDLSQVFKVDDILTSAEDT